MHSVLGSILDYIHGDGLTVLPELELLLFEQGLRFNGLRETRPDMPALFGFRSTVAIDGFALVFSALFLAATGLVILLSIHFLEIEREQEGEFYALTLLACIGMMFMASGSDL